MKSSKRIIAGAAACAASLAAFASPAFAGVADYATTASFNIPNNTGIAGIESQVFVPPGRTAVQKAEVVGVQPSFPGGGGTDLELRLRAPNSDELTLFATGCAVFPNTTSFAVNDEAADLAGSVNFCNTQLVGGAGRPSNVGGDTFGIFNGDPTAGVWTMIVRDVGISGTAGLWKGWTLRITHAPPTLAASAKKQKLAAVQALRASCDANCTLQIGGDAKGSTQKLFANSTTDLAIAIKKKVAKKVRKKGKGTAKVKLTATDETGGTASRTVKLKLKA